jgi:hypothetical protein
MSLSNLEPLHRRSPGPRWLWLAGLCAALLAWAPAVRADEMEEAKAHVAKAKVHYDLGEFEEAAEEYIIVYRIKPIPALLFNIGQAYRQAGKYAKARQFYTSFMRTSDDPRVQATVKKALKELDELIAKEEKTKNSPPFSVNQPSSAQLANTASVPPIKPAAVPPAKPESAPAVTATLSPPEASKPPSAQPATAQEPTKLATKEPAKDAGKETAKEPVTPTPAAKDTGKQIALATAPAKVELAKVEPAKVEPVKVEPAKVEPVKVEAKQPEHPAQPAAAKQPTTLVAVAVPPPEKVGAPAAATQPAPPSGKEPKGFAGGNLLAYVSGGAGVLMLGGGTFFAVQAARNDNELLAGAHTRSAADDLISQNKQNHLVGNLLLGLGAAAVAAGVVLFLLSSE